MKAIIQSRPGIIIKFSKEWTSSSLVINCGKAKQKLDALGGVLSKRCLLFSE